MAETPSSPAATITELDEDSLAQCANYLNLRDISNMAMTCKFFKRVAYSDSVWHRLFSEKWLKLVTSGSSQSSTVRGTYLARHSAVHQFKFVDPLMADIYTYVNRAAMYCCRQTILSSRSAFLQEFRNWESAWALEAVYVVAYEIMVLAERADRELASSGKTPEKLKGAGSFLMKVFGVLANFVSMKRGIKKIR